MSAQERFDRALDALAAAGKPEYDIDPKADAMRIARDGDTYSWAELPEHVRDYWREQAEVRAALASGDTEPGGTA